MTVLKQVMCDWFWPQPVRPPPCRGVGEVLSIVSAWLISAACSVMFRIAIAFGRKYCTSSLAMSQISLNSAYDPLAPLQRWVTYTQTGVLRLQDELRAAIEEEQSVRTLRQRQLDDVQVQLRDMDQRLSEVVDAVTELFNKQRSVHEISRIPR